MWRKKSRRPQDCGHNRRVRKEQYIKSRDYPYQKFQDLESQAKLLAPVLLANRSRSCRNWSIAFATLLAVSGVAYIAMNAFDGADEICVDCSTSTERSSGSSHSFFAAANVTQVCCPKNYTADACREVMCPIPPTPTPKPLFVAAPHIPANQTDKVSTFRSLVGHSYCADMSQHCCESDKHYFSLTEEALMNLPTISSPVNGTITTIRHEDMGDQIEITVDGFTDFNVVLFHIRPFSPFYEGQKLTVGQELGRHYTAETYSDVAVRNTHKGILTSFFQHMKSDVLGLFGITNATEVIIPQVERDACPSNCTDIRDQLPPCQPEEGHEAPPDWFSFR